MTKTVRDDVARFRASNGLCQEEESRPVWMAQLGSFIMPLPNFRWRREVILRHDAHHVLTGYPATSSGELSIAAWEVGAKCYDDWRARAFCTGLMLLGFARQPCVTYRAYTEGKALAGDYAALLKAGFLDLPSAAAAARFET